MRQDVPSRTAAWVAGWRGLGHKLPADARLVDDPYGAWFSRAASWSARLPAPLLAPQWPLVLHMQVRTRVLDDVLRGFLRDGGRQLVILGAGYDCRAARFADELAGARVFEVDHPATQGRKRSVLEARGVKPAVDYAAWDFERRPLSELPAALAALGHDPHQPTLTLWEGVTMYLSLGAIDLAVRAVRALSSPGSPFALTYVDQALFDRPDPIRRATAAVVALAGEPFVTGFSPSGLAEWASERGYAVDWDTDLAVAGQVLLPPRYHVLLRGDHRIARLRAT